MRRWWQVGLWVLLAASLSLNLFFLGGYFQTRRDAQRLRSDTGARELIVDRLGLDPEQRETLEQLAADLAISAEAARSETRALRRAFWDELSSPTPDGERLDSLLERMTGARLGYHRETLAAALELIETLSPDQRREFRGIIREHDPFGLRSLTGSIPRRDRDSSLPGDEVGPGNR